MNRYKSVLKESNVIVDEGSIICDYCEYYSVHPSGIDAEMPPACLMYKSGKLDLKYVSDRMNAIKFDCKLFSKL